MTTTRTAPATTDDAYGLAPAGYRLPASTTLGVVRLQVADLERSLAYYQQLLGMRLLERGPSHARLGVGGEADAILELRERPGARPVPRRGRLGLYHFAILLPDRAALGRFVAHLGRLGAYAGMSDHLVSEAVYLTDPDGLGIEVYADRPRSKWRHDDRQLRMATEPLDVDDLLRAAGGVAWTGMPAGTVIGHVHLFVGELATAAAFYHEAIGFDKVVWSYPGALFLSAGGYHHHLGTNTWAQHAPVATEEDARMLEWEIVLPDEREIALVAESLERGGYTVARGERAATVVDPWGVRVRFVVR